MAFFKFRQRGQPQPETRRSGKPPAAAEPQETIDSMRRRARHRLLGAAVLVLVAVVGFPMLFDTQPRPVAVDAPITIPDKDQAPPLQSRPQPGGVAADASLDEREQVVAAASPARPDAGRASAAPAPRAPEPKPADTVPARAAVPPEASPGADTQAAEDAARARREEAARAQREQETEARARREQEAQAKREQETQARREREAQAKRDQDAQAKREQEARAKREADERARREEAARAKALLEGRSPAAAPDKAAADSGRFIVQIGAFADAGAARDVRQKAERAGLKTYTQVIDTAQGKRTRVRVGPYPSRAEAEKAAAALKRAGLAGSILSL